MVSGFKKQGQTNKQREQKLLIIFFVCLAILVIKTVVSNLGKTDAGPAVSMEEAMNYSPMNEDGGIVVPTEPQKEPTPEAPVTPTEGMPAPDAGMQTTDGSMPAADGVKPAGEDGSVQGEPPVIGENEGLNAALKDPSDIVATGNVKITKSAGKRVLIGVDDIGTINPFMPTIELKPVPKIVPIAPKALKSVSNVPKVPLISLPLPPTAALDGSDAAKVMTATISGILYDKYSPSAIINIEGTDYLVKKNDVVNNYKILYIGQSQVVVQYGRNIYKAGVGQLLTLSDLNYNPIANLNKKFGGNQDIQIRVKK